MVALFVLAMKDTFGADALFGDLGLFTSPSRSNLPFDEAVFRGGPVDAKEY